MGLLFGEKDLNITKTKIYCKIYKCGFACYSEKDYYRHLAEKHGLF